jgi:hypothetical protein
LIDNNKKGFGKVLNTMGQLLSWLLLIVPWFLLIPLDSKRIRHFSSVVFFTIFLDTIFWQIASVYHWWIITNNVFFLKNISSFTYGFLPVTTLLVFYFTYNNVWLFFGTNIIIDAFQAFIVSPFIFGKLGLCKMTNLSNLGLFILLLSLVPIIYLYQKWYEAA